VKKKYIEMFGSFSEPLDCKWWLDKYTFFLDSECATYPM